MSSDSISASELRGALKLLADAFSRVPAEGNESEFLSTDAESLTESLVEVLNAALRFCFGIARGLKQVDPSERNKVLAHMVEKLDMETAGNSINAVSEIFRRACESEDEAFPNATAEKITELMNAADFGKIRKAFEAGSESFEVVWEALAEGLAGDPANFANVFNTITPVLNTIMKIVKLIIARLDFPPEILASAIFRLIEDIHVEEAAGMVNEITAIINKIHEGSILLGREEPRTVPVISEFAREFMDLIDAEEAFLAAEALAEQAALTIKAVSDRTIEKPEFVKGAFASFVGVLNIMINVAEHSSSNAMKLPSDARDAIARTFFENFDIEALSKTVDFTAELILDSLKRNTDIVDAFIEKILIAAEFDVSIELFRLIGQRILLIMASQNKIADVIDPEKSASAVNTALKMINSMRMTRDDPKKALLYRTLPLIDKKELKVFLKHHSLDLSLALRANPDISADLLLGAFRIARGLFGGLFKRTKDFLIKRGG